MQPFDTVAGRIAPMPAANIDTDVIMPKQFLKGVDRSGLDGGVFFDRRFLASGEENPDFVLNQSPWRGACFLAVGPNFGCGSSREHAVWGLKQLGIRALIGTTFAGIFFDNCQRNGLLLIELAECDLATVLDYASSAARPELSIDLPSQRILLPAGRIIDFEIDEIRKRNLVQGLDAIAGTLRHLGKIESFEQRHLASHPWLA